MYGYIYLDLHSNIFHHHICYEPATQVTTPIHIWNIVWSKEIKEGGKHYTSYNFSFMKKLKKKKKKETIACRSLIATCDRISLAKFIRDTISCTINRISRNQNQCSIYVAQ